MSDVPQKPLFEETEVFKVAYAAHDAAVLKAIQSFDKERSMFQGNPLQYFEMINRHALELRVLIDKWRDELKDLRQQYDQGEL